jgi:hypothetical protein
VDLGLDNNISGSGRINISASIKISNEIIIKSPYRVTEENFFKVSVKDNNNNSLKSYIIIWTPSHFPRLKYGDTVEFKAPSIFRNYKSYVKSKIFIINCKKRILKSIEIIITNK